MYWLKPFAVFAIAIIINILTVPSLPSAYALSNNSFITKAVLHYSKLYNIDPCVVFAIIEVESSNNPYAITVNYNGRYRSYKTKREVVRIIQSRYQNMDIGLMQVNYYWLSQKLRIQKQKLLDPLYNIDIGEWLLHQLLDKYHNDYNKAVAAYHSSNKYEGLRYLKKVVKAYNREYQCRKMYEQ